MLLAFRLLCWGVIGGGIRREHSRDSAFARIGQEWTRHVDKVLRSWWWSTALLCCRNGRRTYRWNRIEIGTHLLSCFSPHFLFRHSLQISRGGRDVLSGVVFIWRMIRLVWSCRQSWRGFADREMLRSFFLTTKGTVCEQSWANLKSLFLECQGRNREVEAERKGEERREGGWDWNLLKLKESECE